MHLVAFTEGGTPGLGLRERDLIRGWLTTEPGFPGDLGSLIGALDLGGEAAESLKAGRLFAAEAIVFQPPLSRPNKILCVGLNYRDHTAESGYQQPTYPAFFTRFTTTLIAHRAPIIRPRASVALDFEGELVAIIGCGGRHIAREEALEHVAGYSIFNDASIRDYQHKTPQWTIGKNFDGTGAFGPTFVTADELPAGARGLKIETRLNGDVVQSSNTKHLIFDVATLVSLASEVMTLLPGDLIITGTPAGVGHSRKPPLYMKPGDQVEVEIEGIGVLSNPIADGE